jgi:hypothetical protein
MKKLLTRFAGLVVLGAATLFSNQIAAQGTHESATQGTILRIKSGGTEMDFTYGGCGFGTTINPPTATSPAWGGTVMADFCAPIVWGYGVNQDTFGCTAMPAGSLTGKVALIRRGGVPAACNFSLKALNAQNAGAVAVVIANHNLNATDDDCTVLNMPGGAEAAQVTIPVYSVCRRAAKQIDAAIRSANGAEICVQLLPDVFFDNVFLPTASKRTPVSQIAVDTLGFGAYVSNRTGNDLVNFKLKADVLDVANANALLYSTEIVLPTFAAGITDSFVVISFGEYAPELPAGEYTVRYSASHDNVVNIGRKDTRFLVTTNLFAKDDGATIAYRTNPAGDFGVGAMYTMNPKITEKYMAKTIQFQFGTNASELPTADVTADIYLFKIKDDVLPNLSNFVRDAGFISPSFDWLGTTFYDAPAGAANYSDQSGPDLVDINTGNAGVELQAGKRYVAAVQYTGNNKFVFHAFDEDAETGAPSMFIHWPTGSGTNNWYNGFANQEELNPVVRMFIDLVNTTDENPLPESSLQVRPNPIVETLNLQVELTEATDVTVTIAEMTGRVITYEVREGFTNGLLTYQLPQLASGTYLARIATKQGTLTKKFIVQK